jgi:hypothetical protein
MELNFDNQLIMHILQAGFDVTNEQTASFDKIIDIIMNKFEDATRCKLYNKSEIIKEIKTKFEADKSNLMSASSEAINKNIIPEISFSTMFKSNLDFTLVFKEDNIIILYKNKNVELENLVDIKSDLLVNKLEYFPTITKLYVDNIITIITKLINKDISVKYNLVDFPTPYWNLFEIKCNKASSNISKQLEKCEYLENIITGKLYNQIKEPDTNSEFKAILMQIEELENKETLDKNYEDVKKTLSDKDLKERDNNHRMEILAYLNDNEVTYFFDKLEYLDELDKTLSTTDNNNIVNYIRILLEAVSCTSNKMIRYYIVNKIFSFMMKIKDFLIDHKKFRDTICNKIIELQDDIYIIQTAGLDFSKEIVCTFDKCKIFMVEIETALNPNYVPKWNNSTQQVILNQINKLPNSCANNKYYDDDDYDDANYDD